MQFLPYLSPELDGFDKMPDSAKLLYLLAQIYEVRSMRDLARRAGVSKRTVTRMAKLLCDRNWLRIEHRNDRIIPIPILPQAEDERRARIIRACYEVSPLKGEFIMGTLLNTAVIFEDQIYNARPDFLRSPLTGENLEYDFYSPCTKNAWEYQGFQHFGPTQAFPSKEKLKQQQANDLMKLARSVEHGVTLVAVTYNELSLESIINKLPTHLPKRSLDTKSLYIRTIESIAADYRRWAARIEKEMQGAQVPAGSSSMA